MPWEIEITDEFEEWWYGLTPTQRFAVDERVELLERDGPQQVAPYVKRIKHSRLHNLKELRCNEEGSLRILFAFDPRRFCLLLLGGDKTGHWKEWYAENIPAAEALYDQYLGELKDEGLL